MYISIYSNILLSYVLLIAIMVPSNSDLHVPRKYGELILTKTHLICYTFTCCICESYWYLPWVDVYPPISEFISNRGPALYTSCKIKANKVCSPSSAVEDFVLQNCKAVRVIPHHTRTTNLWDLDWVFFKENIFEEHLDKENIIKHLVFCAVLQRQRTFWFQGKLRTIWLNGTIGFVFSVVLAFKASLKIAPLAFSFLDFRANLGGGMDLMGGADLKYTQDGFS